MNEYNTNYDISPRTRRRPLSMRQMVHMLREGVANSLAERPRDLQLSGEAEPEDTGNVASDTSEF